MSNVNDILLDETGFMIPDLPDEPFYDYFDEGMIPSDVVKIMISRNDLLYAFSN